MAGMIEDYAIVGDLQTAALVGRDGSIDWMCLPRFDSPACFAALLGDARHGFWRIAPTSRRPCNRRAYRGDSLVLESRWDSVHGSVTVTDFMPPRSGLPRMVRVVEGVKGTVPMRGELRPRFGHGRVVPWTRIVQSRVLSVAGPDAVWLSADPRASVQVTDDATLLEFTVREGERLAFVLDWAPSYEPVPPSFDAFTGMTRTLDYWRGWTAKCRYRGPWRDAVIRSLIVLKALTYLPTGGIVAAPTSSLPQSVGGSRNWDYRFCWLRDATFTLSCLLRTGYWEEAVAWREWLLRAVAGDPGDLQGLYGLAGQRRLPEEEPAGWLPGYEGSAPVRFGRATAGGFPLDVYGAVLNTLHLSLLAGIPVEDHVWRLIQSLMDFLQAHWREPDDGRWETRGPRRQFVHSKIMCWVAADRALRIQAMTGRPGPVGQWRALRDAIHGEVCREGWDGELRSFVQHYGGRVLDASGLLIPSLGFLPPDDPRVGGTVAAMGALDHQGFLLRYSAGDEGAQAVDGPPGPEGTFVACSLWRADALARTGRTAEAQAAFEAVLGVRNDLGLLSEEWDPVADRQLGNTPQASSHIALVNTALALRDAAGAHAPDFSGRHAA